MIKRPLLALAGILLALFLAACGGGSGGGTVAGNDPGGIGGTGISSGSISAIGSIVVNGRRFDIDSAEISINGTRRSASALEVGYVVDVRGDFGNNVADKVEFFPDLIGPVASTNIVAGGETGTLVVMEQVVRITSTTIFTNVRNADAITTADRVLVSGFRNSKQEIVASHIRLLPDSGDFPEDQIAGRAESVSQDGFGIAGLGIGSTAQPDDGERVIVLGTYESGANPPFSADRLIEADDLGEPADEVELEGIVEAFTDRSSRFTVNGVTVDGSSAIIEGSGLGIDAEVQVYGAFDTDGVLIARRIEVDREENVEIEADASIAPDTTARTIRFLNGRLTTRITDKTRLKDSTGKVSAFGIDDIAQGDRLEVDGYVEDGGVIATRVEREDPDGTTSIEGPVQDVDRVNQQITLLGVRVDVSTADFDGGSIDDVNEGDIVEIEWQEGSDINDPADAVELEEDSDLPD